MKEKYSSPEMEVIVFATEDIIATSVPNVGDNNNELPIDVG